MKNNNLTNPPEIKRNLFKLTKKSKQVINNVNSNNNRMKKINEKKLRCKKKSFEKNNYSKLNSFLSETAPLQNPISKINLKDNFSKNINTNKEGLILSDRAFNNNFDKIRSKNENQTLNLNKNIADIIKRRITDKKIQTIKNKVKKINKNKKPKLLDKKSVTLRVFKNSFLNNNNNKNVSKKINQKIDDINKFNKKEKNVNEINAPTYLEEEEDKKSEKYFETKRLSFDWEKRENKNFGKLDNKSINKENYKDNDNDNDIIFEKIQINNNSKLNFSLDEKGFKSFNSNIKINSDKTKSLKNNNYDYDSFHEEDDKTQINISILNSNINSNSKKESVKNNRNINSSIEKVNPLIISISNFEDNKMNINENINNNKLNIKEKKESLINNKSDKNISIINKDKKEIENIQKMIFNTMESLNINLKEKSKKNDNKPSSNFNLSDNCIKKNKNIYVPKNNIHPFSLVYNNLNNSKKKTYYKKILSNNFSNQKDKYVKEKNKSNHKNSKEQLNMSCEGTKFNKIKKLILNEHINKDLNNQSLQNCNSNNYFALNNCCYNLNNNTNNIFYGITSPSSDFILRLNNNSFITNENNNTFLKLNNTYLNENINNINKDFISNKSINNIFFIKNNEEVFESINFEDFIILESKLTDIKKSLSSKRRIINETFEYINYFYNSSFYQNIDLLQINIIESNYIKISIICKLLSIIICYNCSIDNNIFEQTYLLLKEMVDLNYKNTILLYESFLENITSINCINNDNNFWLEKIKNLTNDFRNKELKKEINELLPFQEKNTNISLIQKIKTNTNFIINNINLILTNIKSYNDECLKYLFKSINKISLQEIFHYFFTYILFTTNFKSSIIGQVIIKNNIIIGNNNIIPYIKTKKIKKYSLVLDLEETLLHFKEENKNNKEWYVDIRPGTLKFLDDISEYYELIVFNEGEKKFTDFLIDSLEQNKIYFEHRFYREHIIIDNNDIVKDLVRIGRDLDKILIVDNMKQNFKFQKNNGILIKSFYGKDEYNILEELGKILIKIAKDGGDIRRGLIKYKNEIINKVTLGKKNNF